MDKGKFIWCRNCDAVHHVTRFDKAPLYRFSDGEVEESAADDWRDFMHRHCGHRLEPLTVVAEKRFPAGSAFDPMSVGYLEVTDGCHRLLLRQSRRSIFEPLSYEMVSGRLIDNGVRLEIQENAIRKEMKHHFSWDPITMPEPAKIDVFIERYRELAQRSDPGTLEICGYSYDDDNVVYASLTPQLIDHLIASCAPYFRPDELKAIKRFAVSHLDGCDVMALVMRRQLLLEQPAY